MFVQWILFQTPEFEKKATNHCTRFGHSLWSANQSPAQEVKHLDLKIHSFRENDIPGVRAEAKATRET